MSLGFVGGTAVAQLFERGDLPLHGAGRPHPPVLLGLRWVPACGAGQEVVVGRQLRVGRENDQPVASVHPGWDGSGPGGDLLPLLGELVEGGDVLLGRISAELSAGLGRCRPRGEGWPLCSVPVEELQPPLGPRWDGGGTALSLGRGSGAPLGLCSQQHGTAGATAGSGRGLQLGSRSTEPSAFCRTAAPGEVSSYCESSELLLQRLSGLSPVRFCSPCGAAGLRSASLSPPVAGSSRPSWASSAGTAPGGSVGDWDPSAENPL